MGWHDAWEQARETLDGVSRRVVRGSASGVEIALLDWGGEGDLVLLHHATGFCGATLAPIAHALRDRFRVVALDARGHGDSTSVSPVGDPNPYDWKTLSADLRAAVHDILEIVGQPRVALALGHSFGGAVILDSAASDPGLFGKLLLCDPVIVESVKPGEDESVSGGPDLASAARRRRHQFPTRAEAFEHFRSRGLFSNFGPRALALYVGEGLAATPEGGFELKCKPEVEAAIFSSAAVTQLDFEAHAGNVTADVTFLHAQRGNFSRERYDAIAGRMPRARVESLDAGHLFPLEEPERVLEIIDELME